MELRHTAAAEVDGVVRTGAGIPLGGTRRGEGGGAERGGRRG